MSKNPFKGEVLDRRGNKIVVGCQIAYAVRVCNHAELRVGTVEAIVEGDGPSWQRPKVKIPVIRARFEGNSKAVNVDNLGKLVVLA